MKPPKFQIRFNNSINNGGYDVHTLKTGVKASVTMADGRATGRTAGDICISRAAIPAARYGATAGGDHCGGEGEDVHG